MDLQVAKNRDDIHLKVTIVGVGQVGMACAYSILNQNIASEITLFHTKGDKLKGELMDMQHGLMFCKPTKISAGTDFAITAGSKLIIITAGARQMVGESRLDLCQRNKQIFESLVPSLAKHSPDAVLLIVSNPVDILTFVAWKLSGFPANRVIGSGTNLDTSRFLFLLSEKLNTTPSNLQGIILGEHGDSCVPIWSGVKVGGVRLLNIYPNFMNENEKNFQQSLKDLHKEGVNSAYEIIKLKGYTNLAIGLSVANISTAILQNTGAIKPVSTQVKGFYGMENEVFLSLPCTLGSQGVTDVMTLQINSQERDLLLKSCKTLESVLLTLRFSSL